MSTVSMRLLLTNKHDGIRPEKISLTRSSSRQCTRCLPCGLAVAQLYHKANTAYIATELGVRRNKNRAT